MQRFFILAIGCLLFVSASRAQDAENLPQFPVKKGVKNAAFDKAFAEVITSSHHYFKSMQNDSGIKSIIDTTFETRCNFPEKNTASLTCAKEYVSLGVRFNFNGIQFNQFFDRLNASLPANFVYTREYDGATKISSYTFFAKDGTKTAPADFPEKVYLQQDDANIVTLGFLIYRK